MRHYRTTVEEQRNVFGRSSVKRKSYGKKIVRHFSVRPMSLYVFQPLNTLKHSQIFPNTDWRTDSDWLLFKVKVKVILPLTISQSVSLGIEHPPGAHDQIFIAPRLLRSCFSGALSLTRGWVFYICCWPLPPKWFSGPSPLGLATIFYCLTFETSLFVASYDSQGHSAGIRPRLHTGPLSDVNSWLAALPSPSPSHIATDDQSVSQ
jgi:hypothetical protein